MRQSASLIFLLSSLVSTTVVAQGTLVLSQNKCVYDKLGQLRQMTDSLWIPVAQELVNEGKLTAAGSAYHSWGDEWNVVVWYTAASIPAFLSAYDELFGRVNKRHPTMIQQFFSWCSDHKDSFYSMGKVASQRVPAPDAQRRN